MHTSEPPTNDIDVLTRWIGRAESSTEVVAAQWLGKLQHTLGREATLSDGDPMPPLGHFVTHIGSVPLGELDRDGHPKRGGFLPPVALPRRMWAGSRLTFDGDIRIGDDVTKTSTIDGVAMKEGRTGPLCFVTVRHELSVGGAVKVTEEQDLVYREDPAPDAPTPQPKPAPADAAWTRTVTPSEVMLFRYSALTFNGHRIHYDRDYARHVEGYPGLVVHGPLTATLLADLAVTESARPLRAFAFRAMSPLFDTTAFTISGARDGDTVRLWATTPAGGLAMQADATLG